MRLDAAKVTGAILICSDHFAFPAVIVLAVSDGIKMVVVESFYLNKSAG